LTFTTVLGLAFYYLNVPRRPSPFFFYIVNPCLLLR